MKYSLKSSLLKIFLIFILISIAAVTQSCGSSPKFTGSESTTKDKTETPPTLENKKNNEAEIDLTVLETTVGVASYYAEKFHGRQTASGEIYDKTKLTAAHLTYPFGTIVKVTNTKNSLTVRLKINDRMPNYNGRLIDVSYQAAKELGMLNDGLAQVKIEVLKWGFEGK